MDIKIIDKNMLNVLLSIVRMLDLKHPVLDVAVNCLIFCIYCFINCNDAHNKKH